MMESPSCGMVCQISSVIKGMKGCSSRSVPVSTQTRTRRAVSAKRRPPESRLCKLDVPVAETIPNEVVKLLHGDAQLELFEILGHLAREGVEGADDPAVLQRKLAGQLGCYLIAVDVHVNKAGGVPDLIGKVAAGFDLLVGEAHVVSGLLPVARVKRSASAPYCSMISSGSMPLPRDLDIFRPCASRTMP